MKHITPYGLCLLFLFFVIAGTIPAAPAPPPSESTLTLDPAWIRGTLFGKIADPQVVENEYENLYLNLKAINLFFIGHYYGFGSGPAFIHIQDRNLSLGYQRFPGFKGWYNDQFMLGRYDGL